MCDYIQIKSIIHLIIFIDAQENSYYYLGKFVTNNRELCLDVMKFCNERNIPANYIYHNKGKHKYSISVTPYSVEETWQLFHSPFYKLLFRIDNFTEHNKQN